MRKKTVNSLSAGKSSSYMAVKYPADFEVFSLVCLDEVKRLQQMGLNTELTLVVEPRLDCVVLVQTGYAAHRRLKRCDRLVFERNGIDYTKYGR